MVRIKANNILIVVFVLIFYLSNSLISSKKPRKLQMEINTNSTQGFTIYRHRNQAEYYESKKAQNRDLSCLIRYNWSNITQEMKEVNLTLKMENKTYQKLEFISNNTEIIIRRTNITNHINRTLTYYADLCHENITHSQDYIDGKEYYFKRTSLVEIQKFPDISDQKMEFEGSWAYFKLSDGSLSSFKENFIKENDKVVYLTNNKKIEANVTQDAPIIRRFDYDKNEDSKDYCSDVVRNVSLYLRQSKTKNETQNKIISRKLIKILGITIN